MSLNIQLEEVREHFSPHEFQMIQQIFSSSTMKEHLGDLLNNPTKYVGFSEVQVPNLDDEYETASFNSYKNGTLKVSQDDIALAEKIKFLDDKTSKIGTNKDDHVEIMIPQGHLEE